MKKITLFAIFIIATISISAQKVKVKKGEVLIDKVPVLLVEGKASMFSGIDLTYKTLEGEPIFRLVFESFDYFIPTWEDQLWYKIEFLKSKQVMKFDLAKGMFYSDKGISKHLFIMSDPPLLVDNEIDALSIKEFIAHHDATDKIKEDSIDYFKYEAALIKKLKNSKIERNLEESVYCKKTSSGVRDGLGFVIEEYEIIQDSTIIGWMDKSVKNTGMDIITIYKVYKKYNKPERVNGKIIDRGLAAYYDVSSFPEIITIQDKKSTKATLGSAQEIAKYLVNIGLL